MCVVEYGGVKVALANMKEPTLIVNVSLPGIEADRFVEIAQRFVEFSLGRQRLAAHEYPLAVADALEAVPRSHPFERVEQLAALGVPTVVVGSRDEADPGHPLAVAERYAATIPGAELVVEDAGPPLRSPIAWQGGQLSRVITELAARTHA